MSSACVQGIEIVEANAESRRINFDAEWQINQQLLTQALKILDFESDMDFFASGINRLCPRYVAYRADPQAAAVDALSLSRAEMKLCFSTVLCVTQSAAEGREEWSTGGCGGPILAKPALVSPAGEFIDREANDSVPKTESPLNACRSKYGASDKKNTTTTYLQNSGCRLRNRWLSQQAASVVCS